MCSQKIRVKPNDNHKYGALESIGASSDDWNDKEDSINKLSIAHIFLE